MSHFNRCTTRRTSQGIHTIECKLGLWGVSSADKKQVESEAQYYFSQYKLAGEYSSIIGGKSVIDKLVEKRSNSNG